MKFRLILILLSAVLWVANGLYAIYVNKLRFLQYKKVVELRKLRLENDQLYMKISKILNFEKGLEYAKENKFVPGKPYRIFDFYPYLKGKPLIDFYYVWFGDTPSKIAKKLGIPLKVLIRYNPGLRWGYVIPGRSIIYPVHFPMAEEKNKKPSAAGKAEPVENNAKTDKNR